MNGKKFLKNGILLTIVSLIMQVIGLYFGIYTSNIMGAEGMGIFQLVSSVYSLGITIGIGGISTAVTRISSREIETGSKAHEVSSVKQAMIISFTTAVLTAVAMFIFAQSISAIWIKDVRAFMPIRILALDLPFLAVSICLNAYFMTSRRIITASIIMLVEQFVRVGITFLMLQSSTNDVVSCCVAICFASLISNIFSCILKLFMFGFYSRNIPKKQSFKNMFLDILSISLPIGISSCIRSFLNMLQNILVPVGLKKFGLSSTQAISAYGIVKGMAIPVVVFPASILSSFIALLIPEISRFYERGNKRAIGRAIIKSTSLTIIFSIALTGVFITYGNDIGYIFYSNKEVGKYIKLLAPLITFMFLDEVVDCMLKGLNQQMKSLKYNIIESSVRVLMLYFLVPKYGVVGYLVVIFTGNILNFGLSFNRLTQIADVYIDYKNWIFKPLVAILISCIFTKSFLNRGIILFNYSFTILFAVSLTLVIFLVIIFLWDCIKFNRYNHI